jgi:hydrogenase nickel incorporation protein HypB
LILRTIQALQGRRKIAVIEGDIASTIDADKVRAVGVPAVQINTGGNCHLDAVQVQKALAELPLEDVDLLFIENVGNLICPVAFDLGEHTRVALTSIPEGDDKPHKYPGIFAAVDALVITKTDLLPWVPFNLAEFRRLVRGLNPDIRLFEVSCVSGAGLDEWVQWLMELTVRK